MPLQPTQPGKIPFCLPSLQVAHSPYKGVIDCVGRMAREEGMASFYRSYRTTLVMSVPYQTVRVIFPHPCCHASHLCSHDRAA
eukprot:11679-Chlamydomonas_euryale.AAC.2